MTEYEIIKMAAYAFALGVWAGCTFAALVFYFAYLKPLNRNR